MNIEELKRLAEAATPGPWATGFFGTHCVMGIGSDMQKKDAAFIAAANPTAILELIRQRDELLAALDLIIALPSHPMRKKAVDIAIAAKAKAEG